MAEGSHASPEWLTRRHAFALAAMLGCDWRTIVRWAQGRPVRPVERCRAIDAAARQLGVVRPDVPTPTNAT